MTTPYLDIDQPHLIRLPERGGLPKSAYVIDERTIHAVNFALAAQRPLLVRGDPGVGKTALARAVAWRLGRAFVCHAVDSRTETRDLLWTLDSVVRLAQAQLLGALGLVKTDADVKAAMNVMKFVQPGPLWWAFDWRDAHAQAVAGGLGEHYAPPGCVPDGWDAATGGVVVLCDEIDKADVSVTTAMLDALGSRRFAVPGGATVVMRVDPAPLVVFTTNEERVLPDAFLRRCIVLPLALPEDADELHAELTVRGMAHFDEDACALEVLDRAADIIAGDRARVGKQHLMRPGLAEYLDLLSAVTERFTDTEQQLTHLDEISEFTDKHATVPRTR